MMWSFHSTQQWPLGITGNRKKQWCNVIRKVERQNEEHWGRTLKVAWFWKTRVSRKRTNEMVKIIWVLLGISFQIFLRISIYLLEMKRRLGIRPLGVTTRKIKLFYQSWGRREWKWLWLGSSKGVGKESSWVPGPFLHFIRCGVKPALVRGRGARA